MGGYGSGPQTYGRSRRTVEECFALGINRLARDGMFRTVPNSGDVTWRSTRPGSEPASVGFRLEGSSTGGLTLRLIYTNTYGSQELDDVDEPIRLTNTFPHFGGVRKWFICPLIIDGRECNRRVGKLYLPPRAKYFGCRHCHDLTYRSCRNSRRFDGSIGQWGRIFARAIGKAPAGRR